MTALADQNCVRITADSPRLTGTEVESYLLQLPGWKAFDQEGEQRIQREYKFKDFSQALAFTNRIGALADQQDHHPALLTEWGKVTVTWWTHRIKGLHLNDFIMAAKTDREYSA